MSKSTRPASSGGADRRDAALRGRRRFLIGLASLAGAASTGLAVPTRALAQAARPLPPQAGQVGVRYVLRHGIVLSMDSTVGDFLDADVLVEGARIVAVGPNLDAGDAPEVDARGMVVMPGFVDTHHHQFETALRSTLAEGLLSPTEDTAGRRNYFDFVISQMAPLYRPEDGYASIYLSGLSQLDAGVTTVVDISQINHTPEHTDAAIDALRATGRRAVMAYAEGYGPRTQFPRDVRRIAAEAFASRDQLLTLAMAAEPLAAVFRESWSLGRDLGLPIVSHMIGSMQGNETVRRLAQDGLLGPHVEFIHVTGTEPDAWRLMADAGVGVSIASPIEMTMRHGTPPIQMALDHGIQPSLSVDVETTMTADFFTQMRSVFTLQRMEVNARALAGDADLPALLSARDVIRFATVEGARVAQLADKVGSLTPGKEADIIMLTADALNVAPLNNVPGAVVTLMERSNVDTVIVAGAVRKWAGRLVDVDVDRAINAVVASRDYLMSVAGAEVDPF